MTNNFVNFSLSLPKVVEHFSASLTDKYLGFICPMTALTLTQATATFTNRNYNQSHMLCLLLAHSQMFQGGGGRGRKMKRRACWLACKCLLAEKITIMIKAAAKFSVLSKSDA